MQVPQNHSLFPAMTVDENIELGGYMLGSRALVASRRASVEALFPDISRLVEEEGRQPVRRPAAAGRVRALPDA